MVWAKGGGHDPKGKIKLLVAEGQGRIWRQSLVQEEFG